MSVTQRLRQRGKTRPAGGLRANCRGGVAAVELALCLPVLLITALGMIETCNTLFVQARMQSAAYEAVRYATRPTTATQTAATNAQVITYAGTLLTQLGVSGATVTVTPASISTATTQTVVTVSITAPLSSNSVSSFVVKSMNITAAATMIIE
jgi:Flp pilus assembly protein TadG